MGAPRFIRRHITPAVMKRIQRTADTIGQRAKADLEKDLATSTFSAGEMERRARAPILPLLKTSGDSIYTPPSQRVLEPREVNGIQASVSKIPQAPLSKLADLRRRSHIVHRPPGSRSSTRWSSASNKGDTFRSSGHRAFSTTPVDETARLKKKKKEKQRSKSFNSKPSPTRQPPHGSDRKPSDKHHSKPQKHIQARERPSKHHRSQRIVEEDLDLVEEDIVEETLAEIGNPAGSPLQRQPPPHIGSNQDRAKSIAAQGRFSSKEIQIEPVDDGLNKPIAILRKNLQRIPFNPGVHALRDPRTGVWNFDPEQLHDIPTPAEFAYNRTPPYFPPGKDQDLLAVAKKSGSKYIGSTSTLSKPFSQIYFAISGNRALDLSSLSQSFLAERADFTPGATLPATLRIGKSDDGYIFIDNDKTFDTSNILSKYGVILEKMLTAEPEDFKRFLVSAPDSGVSDEERNDRGAYQYQKANKLLMRSQLDCWDPRLPGTGVFDIKTRACVSIRQDRANYFAMSEYDIAEERGYLHSYEREYFDLVRSAMLKYSMQVRIGMMDGIFLAYHNTKRLFGFQYIPLTEMDKRLFGSSEMGDAAFKHCVALFETLLEEVLQVFPDQEVLVTIRQMKGEGRNVSAFVQLANWDGPEDMRPTQEIQLMIRNEIDGQPEAGAIGFSVDAATRKNQEWVVNWTIYKSEMDAQTQKATRVRLMEAQKDLLQMLWLNTPEGWKPGEMAQFPGDLGEESGQAPIKWKLPDARIKDLRVATKESAKAYQARVALWRENPGQSWDFIER